MSNNIVNIFDFNNAPLQDTEPQKEDPIKAFTEALVKAGLGTPEEIISDGQLHRFQTPEDKSGEKTGWYVFYNDQNPGGAAGDWRHNIEITWSAKTDLSWEEQQEQERRIEETKRKREQERQRIQQETAEKAQRIWSEAKTPGSHPYLSNKQVNPYGIKQDKYGNLIIPVCHNNQICSLQLIDPNGGKKFLTGGAKRGCYYTIPGQGNKIYIAEGYATAATIFEATGATCVVAWDAGNLQSVCEYWRKQGQIIVCADNDWKTQGNPGVTEAQKTGEKVIVPQNMNGTDFNDLKQEKGLQEVKRQLGEGSTYRINIHDWTLDKYKGAAPERKWLVANTIPMGAVTVVSAKGDTGKGMLMLDLALKVGGKLEDLPLQPTQALGNNINTTGTAVVFTAEDDQEEVHRRLEQIGFNGHEKIHIIPLPNAGGPSPIVQPGKNGPEATPFYYELKEQLKQIPDLALVNFDPLASFVMDDINADPAVGVYTMGLLASIGTETGAAVITCHHLSKTSKNISGPEDARQLVRGSTAIVDGARCVYVLWSIDDKRARQICKALGKRWAPNMVCQGCVVKSNGPADRDIKTFVRNEQSGLLEIRDDSIKQVISNQNDQLLELLEQDIANAAADGFPFVRSGTGENSLYSRIHELSSPLQECGRRKLESLAQNLIEDNRVKKCRAKGSKQTQWLDVPGGPYDLGIGEFPEGSRQ